MLNYTSIENLQTSSVGCVYIHSRPTHEIGIVVEIWFYLRGVKTFRLQAEFQEIYSKKL